LPVPARRSKLAKRESSPGVDVGCRAASNKAERTPPEAFFSFFCRRRSFTREIGQVETTGVGPAPQLPAGVSGPGFVFVDGGVAWADDRGRTGAKK